MDDKQNLGLAHTNHISVPITINKLELVAVGQENSSGFAINHTSVS